MIKVSSPAAGEFWEIAILFEDEHLLALEKPPGLLTSPDRFQLERPSLISLLHQDIKRGAAWSRGRGLTYLLNAHRLEAEASGVVLLAKTKQMLVAIANLFGAGQAQMTWLALVQGSPAEEAF